MEDAVSKIFDDYLNNPNRETFLAVRTAVADSADYNPYQTDFAAANALINEGKYEKALAAVMSGMANYLLSPRAHYLTGFALRRMGTEEKARFEGAVGNLLLNSLLESGDGTPDMPYRVMCITDEYDVLGELKKTMTRQSLSNNTSVPCDVMECDDGTQIWFDISLILARAEELRTVAATNPPTSPEQKSRWKLW